jgi:hypothetical protein
MYIFYSVFNGVNMKFYDGKRECRIYNILVKYTRKTFAIFYNLSSADLFQLIYIYKNVYCAKLNPKKVIYNIPLAVFPISII